MKMPIKYFLLTILLISPFYRSFGSELETAEKEYKNRNFEAAAQIYTETMEKEGVSAGLLYNLGNCYYQTGNDADAILCYERAKRLDPSNKLINQNLHFLREKIIEANKGSLRGKSGNLEPDQLNFSESIYKAIATDTNCNNWAVFGVMAFLLFLGSLAMYIFTPNVLARKTGFFSGLVFLGFTIFFLILSFIGARQYTRTDEAVMMDFSTELKEQPMENSVPSTPALHKGTKITIIDSKIGTDGKEWVKVKLNSEIQGWIKKDQIEII